MGRWLLLALAGTLAALETAPPPEVRELTLAVGRGSLVDCPEGLERVSTSSPEIVDAVAASPHEVLFQAKALGQATLIVWSKSGGRTVYGVTVEPNLEPFRRLLRDAFPDEQIGVHATREAMALVGHASSQAVADRALALAGAVVKGAISNLQVDPPPVDRQVLLRVRFAELNRNASAAFGINLLSTGALNMPAALGTGQFPSGSVRDLKGSIPGKAAGTETNFSLSDVLNIFAFRPDLNLGVLVKDLQTRGLLQVLAEPNLVTSNGKEASFLAGGEFPVPVAQAGASAGAITVVFREFGIRLSFLPQITRHNTIRLHVKPEVSTMDPANGITLSGFNIPALATRRMESDIELGLGQSFAIAGLIDNRVVENLSSVPGLSHIPLLGALFKSRTETKSRTELIILVTPEIAMPGAPLPIPAMPKPFLQSGKPGPERPPVPGWEMFQPNPFLPQGPSGGAQ
jgi:pilus assembly protein CpaC